MVTSGMGEKASLSRGVARPPGSGAFLHFLWSLAAAIPKETQAGTWSATALCLTPWHTCPQGRQPAWGGVAWTTDSSDFGSDPLDVFCKSSTNGELGNKEERKRYRM